MGQRGLVMVFVADVVCNILPPLSGGFGDDRYVDASKISYMIWLMKQNKTEAEETLSSPSRGEEIGFPIARLALQ